jgi:hypothetical protein
LTNAARINPKLNIKTAIKSASVFFILPEGNGLVGLSSLSTLMSNKSFDTRPPRYKKMDENIKMTRSEILLPTEEPKLMDTAKNPTIISGGTVKILGIRRSFR